MCGYDFLPEDYCYTRHNESTQELAKCTMDSDCSSCWPCGTICHIGDERKVIYSEIRQMQIEKKQSQLEKNRTLITNENKEEGEKTKSN